MSEVRVTGIDSQTGGKVHQVISPEGYPINVTSVHQRIHSGYFFHVWDEVELGVGAQHWIMIYTNGNTPHVRYEGNGSGRGLIRLFEDAVLSGTSSGTFLTPHRKNRKIPRTPTTLFAHTPEITNSGTQISEVHFGNNVQVGGAFGDWEWILQSEKLYLLELESEVASNHIGLNIDFYEVA